MIYILSLRKLCVGWVQRLWNNRWVVEFDFFKPMSCLSLSFFLKCPLVQFLHCRSCMAPNMKLLLLILSRIVILFAPCLFFVVLNNNKNACNINLKFYFMMISNRLQAYFQSLQITILPLLLISLSQFFHQLINHVYNAFLILAMYSCKRQPCNINLISQTFHTLQIFLILPPFPLSFLQFTSSKVSCIFLSYPLFLLVKHLHHLPLMFLVQFCLFDIAFTTCFCPLALLMPGQSLNYCLVKVQ